MYIKIKYKNNKKKIVESKKDFKVGCLVDFIPIKSRFLNTGLMRIKGVVTGIENELISIIVYDTDSSIKANEACYNTQKECFEWIR